MRPVGGLRSTAGPRRTQRVGEVLRAARTDRGWIVPGWGVPGAPPPTGAPDQVAVGEEAPARRVVVSWQWRLHRSHVLLHRQASPSSAGPALSTMSSLRG